MTRSNPLYDDLGAAFAGSIKRPTGVKRRGDKGFLKHGSSVPDRRGEHHLSEERGS
jgi:hypothetical protein